jgi:hypothetical protein
MQTESPRHLSSYLDETLDIESDHPYAQRLLKREARYSGCDVSALQWVRGRGVVYPATDAEQDAE